MQAMREPTPDVVITKETYKGKEVVMIDDDTSPAKIIEKPYIRLGQFRLMDLPAELRVYIYQFLLPYNMIMKLKPKPNPSLLAQYSATRGETDAEYIPEWNVVVTSKHEEQVVAAAPVNHRISAGYGVMMVRKQRRAPPPNHIQTQLFLVSKTISQEARGKFIPSRSTPISKLTPSQPSSTAPTPISSLSTAPPTFPCP